MQYSSGLHIPSLDLLLLHGFYAVLNYIIINVIYYFKLQFHRFKPIDCITSKSMQKSITLVAEVEFKPNSTGYKSRLAQKRTWYSKRKEEGRKSPSTLFRTWLLVLISETKK